MKTTKKPWLILAAALSLTALTLNATDDTDIPVDEDPGKVSDPNKHNQDYIEPPYCFFSKAQKEVYVSFDYYCGNATLTVTGADGQSWTAVSSTMIQPIACSFSAEPGAYTLTITTTSGLAFRGHFIVD